MKDLNIGDIASRVASLMITIIIIMMLLLLLLPIACFAHQALADLKPDSTLVKRSGGHEDYHENRHAFGGAAEEETTWEQERETRRERARARYIERQARRNLPVGQSYLSDFERMQLGSREHNRDTLPIIRRRWRHTGRPLREIPLVFEPFLINGEFPPEELISQEEQDIIPATFRGRLALERENRNNPYYFYEYQYAQRITGSMMEMDAWHRLLANRNPRALRISRDFLKRARWILKEVRKMLLSRGIDEAGAQEQDEEYAYAKMMLELYYDNHLSSRGEYRSRVARLDPAASEARALFQQVYATPWPTLDDPPSSDDEDV